MNLRLVLATAPVRLAERYGRFLGAASTEPAFGLACLAAATREAGVATTIVEAAAFDMAPEAALRAILAREPDVVGLSATTSGIVQAGRLAARLKTARPNLLCIVGGCHATALPAETLREFGGFDLVVRGEGETTLVDTLRAFDAKRSVPSDIPGTAGRTGESVVIHPDRPRIQDMDSLPLPAWDLLPGFPRAFRPSPARIRRWPCASVVLTRGCPNQCTFCDRSVFGRQCRAYSPAYAVRLIRDLHDRYGVREFLIEDDTFVISRERVRQFCELIIESHMDISWSCLGRADRVDRDLLVAMRRAGCWHISYGIESGDPTILEKVRKNLDLTQMRQALSWSRSAGLRTKGFFIVGLPGETPGSLRQTMDVALSLPLDDISVMQLTPFPGSELFEHASELGTFDLDWRKMNTLDTVFVPTGLSRDSMEAARRALIRRFYLRPRVIARHLADAAFHPRLAFALLKGLSAYLRPASPCPS